MQWEEFVGEEEACHREPRAGGSDGHVDVRVGVGGGGGGGAIVAAADSAAVKSGSAQSRVTANDDATGLGGTASGGASETSDEVHALLARQADAHDVEEAAPGDGRTASVDTVCARVAGAVKVKVEEVEVRDDDVAVEVRDGARAVEEGERVRGKRLRSDASERKADASSDVAVVDGVEGVVAVGDGARDGAGACDNGTGSPASDANVHVGRRAEKLVDKGKDDWEKSAPDVVADCRRLSTEDDVKTSRGERTAHAAGGVTTSERWSIDGGARGNFESESGNRQNCPPSTPSAGAVHNAGELATTGGSVREAPTSLLQPQSHRPNGSSSASDGAVPANEKSETDGEKRDGQGDVIPRDEVLKIAAAQAAALEKAQVPGKRRRGDRERAIGRARRKHRKQELNQMVLEGKLDEKSANEWMQQPSAHYQPIVSATCEASPGMEPGGAAPALVEGANEKPKLSSLPPPAYQAQASQAPVPRTSATEPPVFRPPVAQPPVVQPHPVVQPPDAKLSGGSPSGGRPLVARSPVMRSPVVQAAITQPSVSQPPITQEPIPSISNLSTPDSTLHASRSSMPQASVPQPSVSRSLVGNRAESLPALSQAPVPQPGASRSPAVSRAEPLPPMPQAPVPQPSRSRSPVRSLAEPLPPMAQAPFPQPSISRSPVGNQAEPLPPMSHSPMRQQSVTRPPVFQEFQSRPSAPAQSVLPPRRTLSPSSSIAQPHSSPVGGAVYPRTGRADGGAARSRDLRSSFPGNEVRPAMSRSVGLFQEGGSRGYLSASKSDARATSQQLPSIPRPVAGAPVSGLGSELVKTSPQLQSLPPLASTVPGLGSRQYDHSVSRQQAGFARGQLTAPVPGVSSNDSSQRDRFATNFARGGGSSQSSPLTLSPRTAQERTWPSGGSQISSRRESTPPKRVQVVPSQTQSVSGSGAGRLGPGSEYVGQAYQAYESKPPVRLPPRGGRAHAHLQLQELRNRGLSTALPEKRQERTTTVGKGSVSGANGIRSLSQNPRQGFGDQSREKYRRSQSSLHTEHAVPQHAVPVNYRGSAHHQSHVQVSHHGHSVDYAERLPTQQIQSNPGSSRSYQRDEGPVPYAQGDGGHQPYSQNRDIYPGRQNQVAAASGSLPSFRDSLELPHGRGHQVTPTVNRGTASFSSPTGGNGAGLPSFSTLLQGGSSRAPPGVGTRENGSFQYR